MALCLLLVLPQSSAFVSVRFLSGHENCKLCYQRVITWLGVKSMKKLMPLDIVGSNSKPRGKGMGKKNILVSLRLWFWLEPNDQKFNWKIQGMGQPSDLDKLQHISVSLEVCANAQICMYTQKRIEKTLVFLISLAECEVIHTEKRGTVKKVKIRTNL